MRASSAGFQLLEVAIQLLVAAVPGFGEQAAVDLPAQSGGLGEGGSRAVEVGAAFGQRGGAKRTRWRVRRRGRDC